MIPFLFLLTVLLSILLIFRRVSSPPIRRPPVVSPPDALALLQGSPSILSDANSRLAYEMLYSVNCWFTNPYNPVPTLPHTNQSSLALFQGSSSLFFIYILTSSSLLNMRIAYHICFSQIVITFWVIFAIKHHLEAQTSWNRAGGAAPRAGRRTTAASQRPWTWVAPRTKALWRTGGLCASRTAAPGPGSYDQHKERDKVMFLPQPNWEVLESCGKVWCFSEIPETSLKMSSRFV